MLRDFGQLTLESVPMPEPGPGEALVRVHAGRLCGTDLKIVSGGFRGTWPPALPFIIGHEWSGEVAGLGPGRGRRWTRAGRPGGGGEPYRVRRLRHVPGWALQPV